MTELLPCPFCGGEAEIIRNDIGVFIGCFNVDCPIGPATSTYVDGYATEAEAIAAWNTRADYHGYEQAAIEAWESIKAWNTQAERTCRETTIDKFFNGCDSCGYMWQFFYSIGKRERPNYCPNCGAKVVGE